MPHKGFGEAGVPARFYFRKRREHFCNLAVVLWKGEHWVNNLLIRGFLRRNPDAVREYGERKWKAVRDRHTTLLNYSEAKADVVAQLLETAKRSMGWMDICPASRTAA